MDPFFGLSLSRNIKYFYVRQISRKDIEAPGTRQDTGTYIHAYNASAQQSATHARIHAYTLTRIHTYTRRTHAYNASARTYGTHNPIHASAHAHNQPTRQPTHELRRQATNHPTNDA